MSRILGSEFGRVYDRIFVYERRLLLSVLLYIFFAVALIAYANFNTAISTIVAFCICLITNLASVVRTRRLPGQWQPVGGELQADDEDLAHALTREIEEEVGVSLSTDELHHVVDLPVDLGAGTVHFYRAELKSSVSIRHAPRRSSTTDGCRSRRRSSCLRSRPPGPS